MPNILVLVASFIVGSIGLIQTNRAAKRKHSLVGVNRIGLILIAISLVGLIAATVKELRDQRAANEAEQKQQFTVATLTEIKAEVRQLLPNVHDEKVRNTLDKISGRISATEAVLQASDFHYSVLRYSNFTSVDFSFSDFSRASFSNANLRDAFFQGAQLQGADLSEAVIDENTKLPKR